MPILTMLAILEILRILIMHIRPCFFFNAYRVYPSQEQLCDVDIDLLYRHLPRAEQVGYQVSVVLQSLPSLQPSLQLLYVLVDVTGAWRGRR